MKPTWKTWLGLILVVLGILFVMDARMNAAASPSTEDGLTFTVSDPVTPILSQPVRELASDRIEPYLAREVNPIQWLGEGVGVEGPSIGLDPLISRSVNGGTSPDPLVTFEGVPSISGVTPPDTNGDVGPNHYVQMTNFSFQIWDKGDPNNGIPPTALIPPTLAGNLFAPLGGQCTSNFGDPIVLYDDMADRWLLSQFGLSSPVGMCIAISQTPDPTGAYFLYFFPTPDFPDYPKLGVWPDAYYMGTNTGFPNQYFAHAFDRVAMLSGSSATIQSFGGLANLMMPADVDGQVPPPAGDPGIFYTFYHPDATGHPPGPARLAFYHFDVDWVTPGNSSYTLASELPIAAFNYTICGFFAGGCIPQPGTAQPLDDIAWWPMFRMQYRNFGGYAAMVGNFTVDADGANHAGIRWFEVRKTGSVYSLFQEGTHFPDTDSRWMGSIAMDRGGNLALGYSVSSSTTIPSIRYATRLASDPPGSLNAEAEMWTGGGVQTGIHRWGDYSNMAVDPVDGCTFWYTTEYHDTNDSGFAWNTRIGVFRVPTCGGDIGTLTGDVTDSSTSLGIPGVTLYATASPTMTGFTTTNANGVYTMTLIEGTYVVTATAFGYIPDSVNGVNIVSGTVTTQDFVLDPAPSTTFEGYVTDALMDWPLYARVDIEGYPGNPVWNDPVTGYFSVTLPVGTYEVTVDAFIPGYVPTTTEVTLSSPPITFVPSPENITLAGTGVPEKTGAPTPRNTPMEPASVQGGGIVSDPGFEAGTPNPVWTEFSTNFGSPLCTIAFCGTGTGTGPHSGTWWAWFGGISIYEEGSVAQTVVIPNGSATLSFYLEQIVCAAPADYMEVLIDGNQVFLTTGASPLCGQLGYSLQTVDISAYADGGSHTLEFHSEIFGSGITNFFIDDISITSVAAGFNFPLQADIVACVAPGYSVISSICTAPADGGLVVGNVYDLNTSNPVNGAWVNNETGELAYAVATPLDLGVDDAFFTIYSLAGTEVHTATFDLYGEDVEAVGVIDFDTVEQDFFLPSGFIVLTPTEFDVTLEIGTNTTLPLDLTDTGGANVEFEIREEPGTNPFAPADISIPASDGNFAHGEAPPSFLSPPNSTQINKPVTDTPQLFLLGGGAPAYGAEFFTDQFLTFMTDAPGTVTNISSMGGALYFAGDFVGGDFSTLYAVNDNDDILYAIDTATGTPTAIGPMTALAGGTWTGMTADPSSGTMYASSTPDCNTNTLYTVDLGTGAASDYATITGFCIIDIAINRAGDMYAVDIIGDQLLSIDKDTGATTIVGSIGFDANFAQGMDFDEDADLLYLAAFNNSSFTGELRIADLTTGNTALVGNIGTPSTEVDAFAVATGGFVDVPWVSEAPITGTVPANNNSIVDVTFDAAQVPIPGQYTAFLNIAVDTPQLELTVPLTLNVTCSTCGTLQGDITDAATFLPVISSIHITNTGGFDFTIEDVSSYSILLQPGQYSVTASATGYISETATVNIIASTTTTQDFALWANTSILSFSPDSVEEFMDIGDVVTNTVTVTNSGAAPLEYEVRIGGYSGPVLAIPRQTTIHIPRSDGNFRRGDSPTSIGPAPVETAGGTPTQSTLEQLLGSNAYGYEHANFYYTIFDSDVPEVLPNVAPNPNPGANFIGAGEYVDGFVYMVDTGNVMWEMDAATGNILNTYTATAPPGGETYSGLAIDPTSGILYASSTSIAGSTLFTMDAPSGVATLVGPITGFPCIIAIAADGNGDLWGYDICTDVLVSIDKSTGAGTQIGSIGFDANFGQGMGWDPATDTLYMAAFNGGAFLPELRAVDRTTGNTTLIGVLGSTTPGGLAQVSWLGFEISSGTGGWAYAVPDFGTIPPFSSSTFDLVFDARSLYQTGDYFATLSFNGNFVNDPGTMPLTMHVSCPTCGFMVGDIYDAFTSAPVAADVQVTSGGGVTITLTGVPSYSLAVQPGTYDFLITADGYFSETATVTVAQGQTVETDFALTPIIAVLEYSPPSFEQTVALGTVFTDSLWISSTGTVGFDFFLSDVETGTPIALRNPAGGSILLVDDDDNSPNVSNYYTTLLDSMGLSYDVWDTGNTDNEPTASNLAAYDIVIWFTGDEFGGSAGPGAAGETALTTWLNDGGCFFISSQDYVFDRGVTGFMSNYLGLGSATSDVGQTTVTGQGTLFSGLGPYSLSYPFTNWSDLFSPNAGAEVAFSGNVGDAAVNKITSDYTTAFLGFPLEAIPSLSDQTDVMNAFLSSCVTDALWLLETPAAGYVEAGDTEMVYLIYDASVVTQTGTYMAELRFDGTFDNGVSPAQVIMHVVEAEPGVVVGNSSEEGLVSTIVTHTVWVTNTGNLVDTFDLEAAGNTWPTSLSASSISLYPGESGYMLVAVTIPGTANVGDMDTVALTATSRFDTNYSSTGTVQTTAVEFGVNVEADQNGDGAPGEVVNYTITVTNTGSTIDTYDLTVNGNGWTTTPDVSSVTLAAGESATVQISVTIPLSAVNGDSDVAVVTATSQSDSGVSDSVTLTTTAVTGFYQYLPLIGKH